MRPLLALALAGTALAGCRLFIRSSTPPRRAGAEVVVALPAPGGPVIAVAPPAPRHEVRPPGRRRGHVWVPGHWEWRGGRYVWQHGRWVKPPRPHLRWTPAHYRQVQGGWVFVPGSWK